MLECVERHSWQIPPLLLRLLRWQALEIRQNNIRMMRQLTRVAHALLQQGVEVLLLKGAGLNLTQYDRLDLRAMSDLDLLVRPEAAGKAMAVLEDLGCRRGPGLVRSDFFPRFHYEVEYTTGGAEPVRIDLHVRPFRPMRYAQTVPDEAFWDRSRVIETDRQHLRVPGDEEQLIHLATHAACHGYARLIWLYDICRLIDLSDGRLDWDRVGCMCRQWGLVLPVEEALRRTEGLFGPMGMEHVREALRSARVGWRDRLCLAQAPHDARRPLRHVVVNLLCTRGLRFRVAYLMATLLPGREHIGQVYKRRHPGWLACGHLRRWVRAAVRMIPIGRLPSVRIQQT
jgi:hypothetical protein